MIQTQTILKVADNSGAKTAKCIKVLGKSNNSHHDFAKVGDCILVSIRSLRSGLSSNKNRNKRSVSKGKNKIKKGQIYKGLVVRTRKSIQNRCTGHRLSFESNDIVLINNQDNLIGSRVFGPITREIRALNYRKILSQSKKLL